MNEFIELRNFAYDSKHADIFSLLFFEHYINANSNASISVKVFTRNIQKIKKMELDCDLDEQNIKDLFSMLGGNAYIDRYAVDLLLKGFEKALESVYVQNIKGILSREEYNNQKLFHIVELCMECKLDLLEKSMLSTLIEKGKTDLDLLSILIEYISLFKKEGFKEQVLSLLELEYPQTIKLHMLELLTNLYGMDNDLEFMMESALFKEENRIFLDSYFGFAKDKITFEKPGLLILQSMFYGDFEDSGKGNNGGLPVLLRGLGDEVSKNHQISYVFTITIAENLNKPFISNYQENHIFVRLPMYLDRTSTDPFIKRELSIKRYLKSFLETAGIEPDIFHVRYLDNASKAVAILAKDLNKKFVFTLAPDPHRTMIDESGALAEYSWNELILKLNKIKIGDELLFISDGIIGIGSDQVKEDIQRYFPQFKDPSSSREIEMIGEGIKSEDIESSRDLKLFFHDFIVRNNMELSFFDKPIILNVGRLAILKGQINLLKAWSNSKLSQTHNLLIIGGDIENPTKEERHVIDFFKNHLKRNPGLKANFFHKAAMSNENIRRLEKSIVQKNFEYPHVYLCSSIKEEFGLAILEAMYQGFLILGPLKGGVKSYINSGENGFLIDTSSWENIAVQSKKYLYDSGFTELEFKKIQFEGQKTVQDHFSVKTIAKDFLSYYLTLLGGEDHEV